MFKTGHPVCFSIKTGDSCGKIFHQYDCTPRSKKDGDKGEKMKLMNKTNVTLDHGPTCVSLRRGIGLYEIYLFL